MLVNVYIRLHVLLRWNKYGERLETSDLSWLESNLYVTFQMF